MRWLSRAAAVAALCSLGCSGKVERECPLDSAAREALCGFDVQREVLFDDSFSPAERQMILGAMDGWASASGGRITYRMSGDAPHDHALSVPVHSGTLAIIRLAASKDAKLMSDIDSAVSAKGSSKGSVVGYALPGRVMLLVERIPDMVTLQAVAMHELGHDLGLDHSAGTESVMYARISGIDDCVLAAPHATTSDVNALYAKFCRMPQVQTARLPLFDEF